jgi:tRNA pseudouridine38/39 synthase
MEIRGTGGLKLDVSAMQQAAQLLVGEHNFQNFCRMNLQNTTQHVRRILSAGFETVPLSHTGREELLALRIRGTSFLWHQACPLLALTAA